MIQIKRNNLTALAQNHFESLKDIVLKRLKGKNDSVFIFIRENLEKILSGEPHILVSEIINKIPYVDANREEVEHVFNYKDFTNKNKDKYNAYTLSDNLQVNVCPYCNRQYTFTIINKSSNGELTRPDFDHFYLKSKYPYLALSFYNLIPSCKICNSTFKHDKDWNIENYIHPYVKGFDNCKFSLKPIQGKGIDFFYGRIDAFDISFKNLNPQAERNIKDLELIKLYNKHKDYVSEILQRSITYSDGYVNSLFAQYEGTLFSSIGDIKRMISSNYISDEDLEKRVLSKLSRDISEDIGLLS